MGGAVSHSQAVNFEEWADANARPGTVLKPPVKKKTFGSWLHAAIPGQSRTNNYVRGNEEQPDDLSADCNTSQASKDTSAMDKNIPKPNTCQQKRTQPCFSSQIENKHTIKANNSTNINPSGKKRVDLNTSSPGFEQAKVEAKPEQTSELIEQSAEHNVDPTQTAQNSQEKNASNQQEEFSP